MESKEHAAHRKTSPLVRFSTFHLVTIIVKGCDLLLDRESYKTEYKGPYLEERAPHKLEAPPIKYGVPEQERTR
jgi:hypothetical protein